MSEQMMNYLPFLLIFLAVCVYLFTQYRKNGEVTIADLYYIVEIGVKNAEQQYIKSGGKLNRAELCIEVIAGLFGKKPGDLSEGLLEDIEDIKLAVINDLPKTSSRLDNS